MIKTVVTDFEVREHIAEKAAEASKAIKDNTILQNTVLKGFGRKGPKEVLNDSIKAYDFPRDTNAEVLDVSADASRRVLDMYMNVELPFEVGEKREEFKDAFSVLAIMDWMEKKAVKGNVVICTKDIGVQKFFEGKVQWFPELSHVTDFLYEHKEALYKKYHSYLRDFLAESESIVHEQIGEEFEGVSIGMYFNAVHIHSELTSLAVNSGEAKIIAIHPDGFEAEIPFSGSYTVVVIRVSPTHVVTKLSSQRAPTQQYAESSNIGGKITFRFTVDDSDTEEPLTVIHNEVEFDQSEIWVAPSEHDWKQ